MLLGQSDYFANIPVSEGGDYFEEGSKEDALGALKAIVGFLNKQDKPDKDMVKMAKGILDYTKKNDGSMTPDQARWVFNTSKALFK